jgi:opacity protein-like surface antigen
MKNFLSLFLASFAIASSCEALCNGCDIYRVGAAAGLNLEIFGGWAIPELPGTNRDYVDYKKNENYVWGGTAGFDFGLPRSCWLLGVEGSYINFGRTKYRWDTSNYEVMTIKSYGWQVMGKLTYVFFSGWNIFLKGGSTKVHVYSNNDLSQLDLNEDKLTKWVPTVAAGFGIMPCQYLTISLQYQHLFGQEWRYNQPSTLRRPFTQDVITLNLGYKFNLGQFFKPNCNYIRGPQMPPSPYYHGCCY